MKHSIPSWLSITAYMLAVYIIGTTATAFLLKYPLIETAAISLSLYAMWFTLFLLGEFMLSRMAARLQRVNERHPMGPRK